MHDLLTSTIEQSPPWEANRFSASQRNSPNSMEPEGSLPRLQESITCPYLEPDHPVHVPHPTSWKCITILLSDLRLGIPSSLFPSSFLTKTLYPPLLSNIRAICSTLLILLDFFNRITFGVEYRPISSSLYSFLHFHVILSLLGPNILLCTLLTNTPSLRSSLNVSDQFSHPYKTTCKTIFCKS